MTLDAHEEAIEKLANLIKKAIEDTQPRVCCYGEFERPDHPTRTLVGYDGTFDLYALAEALHRRIL